MAVQSPPKPTRARAEGTKPAVQPRFAVLAPQRPRRQFAGYAVAVLGTAALTLSLLPVRNDITPLSKGFGFLVVVVGAAAVGGLWPGLVASVLGFLTFNYYFLPPYDTFIIGRGEYVVVLFVFLGLSILISALLARATERAQAAEAHEAELRALQSLSAELVALVPGPDSYGTVLPRVLQVFGFSAGAICTQDPTARDLREQVCVGARPGELTPSSAPSGPDGRVERFPLSVGGRNLGLLIARGRRPPLTREESRVMRAFCDQLALVLERDRLLRAATEAEVYRQSDHLRRSLLAAVSHDLRSPLAAIKASVTDLLDDEATHDADQSKEALQSIEKETDRLASLIANLLDMSRIEGGVLKPRVQTVDLVEILAAAADRVRHEWPSVEIRINMSDQASTAKADPIFVDRVAANLLDNAGKAASGSGHRVVEIEGRPTDGRTTVRVIDHGKGVPLALREQLFYPFYQMNQRHPRLGTGLGLAISKGFLTLMNGEIWIEDTPGGGATFAFSLPAAED
jgi:two-component system sensor histidine kinase KdpD